MNKKIYTKGLIAIFSISLASTLVGCQPNKTENIKEETSTTQTQDNQNTSEITEYLETQREKDTAAEAAISIMLDGAENLKNSAQESANSEEVQYELDKAMDNFHVLSDFIFNGGEIDGVTFNDLSEEGKQNAKKALNTLDNTLDDLIPNYKERLKNWFTDTAAKGLDALDSLKDKGSEVWDEIQSKRTR